MKVGEEDSDSSTQALATGEVSLPGLVSILGYRLTAYIGGASGIESVVDWLRNGFPADLEPRLRAAFDVVKPIFEVKSELVAQGFLIERREEAGLYHTPACMLREGDAEAARQLLMRVVTKEFLSNEVADLEDVAARLQAWIKHAELPERLGYTCRVWRGQRLSLILVQSGFPEKVQRKWNKGIDWPCWDQVIATVPEMAHGRAEIDLMTGWPFRCMRLQRLQETT